MTHNNLSNRKSSKIKSLYIPAPNFIYFHKPSSEEEVDERFIGREDISEQLTNWLENGDSGSYLITGYRGMGKSSFVGKVLNEITDINKKKRTLFNWFFIFVCLLFIIALAVPILCISIDINAIVECHKFSTTNICLWNILIYLLIISISFVGIISLPFFISWIKKRIKIHRQNRQHTELKDITNRRSLFRYKKWFSEVLNIKFHNKKDKRRIVIKINLGHEILNERDILSLITKRIYDEYKDYIHNIYVRPWFSSIRFTLIASLTVMVLCFCINYLNQPYDNIVSNTGKVTTTYQNPNETSISPKDDQKVKSKSNILKLIKDETETAPQLILILNILAGIILFFLLKFIYDKIIRFIPTLNKMSSGGILKDLKSLNDRIDASINENIGPGASYNPSAFGISFFKRKSKSYSSANIREIETELIRIFERINNLRIGKPKFIIVFDELDKIDPEYNYDTKTKENIPEYDKELESFSGGMISRKRKRNVLKLLGNMKLFVSSAKAKFVFISGRELYDAYLADLTDREFAISSIFNGVIYVNSFFESTKTQKNIISKTEEYICRQLIPKKYYIEKAKEAYKKEKLKIIPDLQLYRQFLENEVFMNKTGIYDFYMDKVILFLYQFAVYLSHISNGSPKKIALYFEKHIDYFDTNSKKNPFNIYKGKYLKNVKYCLKFDTTAQQSIGFIHYMAYPVIQGIINKSNHYGDKLLVSASFLIDHIYKHHKGGFSRDNIEYIPELLEAYRTPELRSFINTILAFLKQTHISHISSGLYYYKFRKWISFEISYFSKISEEISALFNFTLDESLSVKRHYYQQIEYYIKLYMQHVNTCNNVNDTFLNPYSITLIQLYEILGELHLLDDEFADAIMKFQSGLQLMKSELHIYEKISERGKEEDGGKKIGMDTSTKYDNLKVMLLMIKNVLKLGLTYECQQTYNIAYAVYCELLTYLVDFRYINEKDLGLSYAYKTVFDTRQRKSVVFYHERTNDDDIPQKRTSENNSQEQIPINLFQKEVYPKIKINKGEENYSQIDFDRIDYVLLGDNSIAGFSKPLTPSKNAIISRLTLFEDVQFMYQTILAKLFVLEKIDLGGITQTNLDVAENEFAYMYLLTNSQDKYLLAADFYRKLGAILYFKNSYVKLYNENVSLNLKLWGYDILNDIDDFCIYSKRTDNQDGIIVVEFLHKFIESISFDDIKITRNADTREDFKESVLDKFDDIFNRCIIRFEKKQQDIYQSTKEKLKDIVRSFFDSDYYLLPNTFNFKKLDSCAKHYKSCELKGKHIPCYACNYYSRSLSIFAKYLLRKNEEYGLTTNNESRVFDFIHEIHTDNQRIASQRASYLLTLASTLRGMGDVQLSCSGKNDKITDSFLDFFFDMIIEIINKRTENAKENTTPPPYQFPSASRIEKSILYYWAASEYFRMASSYKDTAECLRKILQIFVTYVKTTDSLFGYQYVEKIKNHIVQKAVMNIYTEYDNINIAEIQELKWVFGINNLNNIDLNKLSNFPDIEELLLLYYELELQYDDKKLCIQCYNSIILSPYRIENSIYEKIYSLEFKVLMNMEILKNITIKCGLQPLIFHSSDLPYKYFEFLDEYLNKFDLANCDYLECITIDKNKPRHSALSKMETLIFLITDSIFCLTQIVEILSSSQVSQFTNSFIADTYRYLFNWVQLYGYNHNLFLNLQNNDYAPQDEYLLPLISIIKRRNESKGTSIDSLLHEKINLVYQNAKAALKKYKDNLSPIEIENNLLYMIGNGKKHILTPNYSAEMAIKYYTNAKEIHTEGECYKEMISNMYILDDDINNANITFSLALERYSINNDYIDKKMKQLKLLYGNATYYDVGNYIRKRKY